MTIRCKACRAIFAKIEQASIGACSCIVGFRRCHQVQALRAPGSIDQLVQAGVSAGYYCSIENSKCPPPRKGTLRRLLDTLKVSEPEVVAIERQSAVERGMSPEDGQLPEEAQVLIADIRRYANKVPPRFLKGMRAKLREVAL